VRGPPDARGAASRHPHPHPLPPMRERELTCYPHETRKSPLHLPFTLSQSKGYVVNAFHLWFDKPVLSPVEGLTTNGM